jgi:hypothetical protein
MIAADIGLQARRPDYENRDFGRGAQHRARRTGRADRRRGHRAGRGHERKYETGCDRLIFDKAAFAEPFFILSSGLAGEILQKFVNYRLKVAIVGDYSQYTSKPLHDFIRESNRGRDVFFVSTIEDAVELLAKA